MNTEKIIKEIIKNHSETEVLAYCTSELASKHNAVARAITNKEYEKVAGLVGEASFPLAILLALNDSKGGNKKSVTVA